MLCVDRGGRLGQLSRRVRVRARRVIATAATTHVGGRGGGGSDAVDGGGAVAELDSDGRVKRRRRLGDVLLLPVLVQALAPLVCVAADGAGELGDAVLDDLAVSGRVDLGVVVALGLLRDWTRLDEH